MEPTPPPPIDMARLKLAIQRKVAGKARVSTYKAPQGTRQGSGIRKGLQIGSPISAESIAESVARRGSVAVDDDDDEVSFEILRRTARKLDRRRHKGHDSEPRGFASGP